MNISETVEAINDRIFDHVGEYLSEFEFRKGNDRWTSHLHVDMTPGSSRSEAYIRKVDPYFVHDVSKGEGKQIYKLYSEIHGVSYVEAVNAAATLVGVDQITGDIVGHGPLRASRSVSRPATRASSAPRMEPQRLWTFDLACVYSTMYGFQFAKSNNFFMFLCSLFDLNTVRMLHTMYAIGTPGTSHGEEIVFWQIDKDGRPRGGKVIPYKSNGKRYRKEEGKTIYWIHSRMVKDGQLDPSWKLSQCLFGEHLLTLMPNKIVALVESEKTAVIGAGCYPDMVWLATGGKDQFSDKMKVLKGRTVLMYPDIDGMDSWRKQAQELNALGYKIKVSSFLEKHATDEQRTAKADIADVLVDMIHGGTFTPPPMRAQHHWLFNPDGTTRTDGQRQAAIAKSPANELLSNPIVKMVMDGLSLRPLWAV